LFFLLGSSFFSLDSTPNENEVLSFWSQRSTTQGAPCKYVCVTHRYIITVHQSSCTVPNAWCVLCVASVSEANLATNPTTPHRNHSQLKKNKGAPYNTRTHAHMLSTRQEEQITPPCQSFDKRLGLVKRVTKRAPQTTQTRRLRNWWQDAAWRRAGSPVRSPRPSSAILTRQNTSAYVSIRHDDDDDVVFIQGIQ
jgi:hypothetical protein